VAAHKHVIFLGEAEQEVRPGKVVLIGRRTEGDPFQLIGGNNHAALPLNELGEVGIVLHVANYDRGAERQTMAARMDLK
jgi:hypothetical protein